MELPERTILQDETTQSMDYSSIETEKKAMSRTNSNFQTMQEVSILMNELSQESNMSYSSNDKSEKVEMEEPDDKDLSFIESRMESIKDRGTGDTKKALKLMEYLRKYEVKKGSTKTKTNGFMGLRLFISVPMEESLALLLSYYESIFPGGQEQKDPEDFCFAECLSEPLFKFFMDCDFKWTVEPSKKDLGKLMINVGKCFVRTLKKFFPHFAKEPTKEEEKKWNNINNEWEGSGTGNNRYRILIATSGKKEGIKATGEKEWGLGLHIYSIGRCRVTSEQALLMRKYLLQECVRSIGYREVEKGENTWESVLDSGVLKGLGGVRMLYCSKVKGCSDCAATSDFLDKQQEQKEIYDYFSYRNKGQKSLSNLTSECSKCGGRKKVLSRQSYKPIFVMNANEEIDTSMDWLCKDRKQAILATSIRTGANPKTLPLKEQWTWPTDLGDLNVWLDSLSIKEKRPLEPKTSDQSKIASNTAAKLGQMYSANSDEMNLALQAIYQLENGVYHGVKPDGGLKRRSNYIFRLDLDKGVSATSPSRWCVTCQRHHDNRTLFEFRVDGIYQKSHSQNCSPPGYTKYPISDELIEILFGKMVPKQFAKKKSKPTMAYISTDFSIPSISEQNKTFVPLTSFNPVTNDSFKNYYNYLVETRKNWINMTFTDEKRKKLIETEKKKWKSTTSKKSEEQRPRNVPYVYVNDDGKECITTPNSIDSDTLTAPRPNNKKPSQTIQWASCVSKK